MENRFQWKCANKFSLLFLIVVYFFGYMFLVPVLARNLTLFLNSNAIVMSIPILTILYAIILVLSVLITRPLWQEAWDSFKQNIVRNLFEIITMTFFVLALNFALSMVVSLITGTPESVNQENIKVNTTIAPIFMLFSSVIFAPIVEESVFRGGIFSYCRKYMGFVPSAIISGFFFGCIHVMGSFITFQFTDLVYLVVYGGLGFFFCYCYEKKNSIVSSAGVHALNNLISFMLLGV